MKGYCVFGTSTFAYQAQRRQTVSLSISTLLTRNLHDVFGEFTETCS